MSFSPTNGSTSSQPSAKPGVIGNRRVEIVTIPEKFYGVALTMDGKTQAERDVPPPPLPSPKATPVIVKPPERKNIWPYVALILSVLIVVSGVFAYVNRDLLFQKTESVPPPPPPKVAPNAPANLSASSSAAAVMLSWVDGGGDETGIRIERQEFGSGYTPLTVLPARSIAFLDVAAQPGRAYTYRVVAFGDGGESSPSNEASIRVPEPVIASPPPPPAPSLPPGGLDSDSDGLTDVEEPLYGTDLRSPDADNDGFLDGNEVFHLYNPAAKSPVRLLDSGLVKLFSAPAGWSLLMPANWTAGLDIPDGSQATITPGTGETVVLRIEDNPTAAALADWYIARTAGANASSVRPFVTKGGLQGVSAGDRLEALFAWGNKVFTLRYIIGGQPFINYRTTFELMLNSLKLVGVPAVSLSTDASTGPGSLTGAQTAASTSTLSALPVPDASSSTAPAPPTSFSTSTFAAPAVSSSTSPLVLQESTSSRP